MAGAGCSASHRPARCLDVRLRRASHPPLLRGCRAPPRSGLIPRRRRHWLPEPAWGAALAHCGVAASAPRSASPLPAPSSRVCPSAHRLAWWLRSSPPLGAAAPSGRCRTCSGAPLPPCTPRPAAAALMASTALALGGPSAATSASRGSSVMGALHRVSPRGRASRWLHDGWCASRLWCVFSGLCLCCSLSPFLSAPG